MKDISKFANVAGTVSGVKNQLDSTAASQDKIFAEAVMTAEPTSILEEAGIIRVQATPNPHDQLSFPIMRNTQLTWYEIDARTGSNALGSELGASGLNAVEYKTVRPTRKSASIFLPDEVSLLNKISFDMYATVCARDAKRKKESDALTTLTTEASFTHTYTAGAGTLGTGLVGAGSKITPEDLVAARRVLSTGSNISVPDFVLMHPNQYEDFNTDDAFAPGATSPGAMMRKVGFDANGNVTSFQGMQIYATELIPAVGSGTGNGSYATAGHPVVVGTRGMAIGRGEREGITIHTVDDRIRHGQYKVIDMDYDHTVLAQETVVLLRAAD